MTRWGLLPHQYLVGTRGHGARQPERCATHAATRTRCYGVVRKPVAGNIPPFVYWNEKCQFIYRRNPFNRLLVRTALHLRTNVGAFYRPLSNPCLHKRTQVPEVQSRSRSSFEFDGDEKTQSRSHPCIRSRSFR
jgi:hypothetical protein